VWKAARLTGWSRTVTSAWVGGTAVELVLSSDIGRCVFVARCFEPNELFLLSRLLSPGGTFVDVGANIGLYTVAAARMVGPAGSVLAIEPSERERALLQRNLARNGNTAAQIETRAVGERDGEVARLHLADIQHGGQNTLGAVVYENVRIVSDQLVNIATLDSILADHGLSSVDVVKIDVEGGEHAVLMGASHLLASLRPIVMLELQDESLAAQGSSANEVLATLAERHYAVFGYADAAGSASLLRPLKCEGARVTFPPQDVVAVPEERLPLSL